MSESLENNNFSDRLKTVVSYSERLPYDAKKANNWAWAKRRGDAVDLDLPDAPSDRYIDEAEDNYRQLSGLPPLNYTNNAKEASTAKEAQLLSEGIVMPDTKIKAYYDVVSPYIDIIQGDRKRGKLYYIVSDSSLTTKNFYKKAQQEKLTKHIEEKIIQPARQMAFMEWSIQNGVQDIFQLDPEMRQQAMSEIDAMAEQTLPADIARFTKAGANSPLERQGQQLAEALVQYNNIKELLDEAYLHSYATDAAIFASEVRRNKPIVRLVDALNFNTRGGNDRFIDKNPEFKEVEYLHPTEIWNRYGEQFTRADIKKFDEMVGRYTGSNGNTDTTDTDRIAMRIDFKGEKWLNEIDTKTAKGQLEAAMFHTKYTEDGSGYQEYNRIRVAHLTWMSLAKMRLITRGYNDGTVRVEWFTEDYQFNPDNGDLEEKIEWVPQYFRITRIGEQGIGDQAIYVNPGPVPYQRRDPSDPYNVKSPYTGGYFNDLRGRGYRNPTLSRVREWVHAFQFQMQTIREREATDIGKVVLMTVAAKPKGWSWGKFLEVVRATKMLPINTQQAGLTPMDVQFFKDIDLSNLYDMLPRLNYLNFILMKIAELLGVNQARQGAQPASTSVTNNMTNLERSYSQTHSRGAWLDEIAGRLIENQLYLGRMCAQDGSVFMRYVLDDLSMAHIDIDIDGAENPLYSVRVMLDSDKIKELDIAKNYLQPYLQNQGMPYKYALRTLLATTKGELLDIADEAQLQYDIQQAKAADAAGQQAQQQMAMTLEMEKAIAELKNNLEMMRDEQNNNAKRDMAALQAMTLANANDIDQDGQNDFLESSELDRQVKVMEILAKDQLERDKLALEQWSTKETLIAQLKKIEVMKEQAKARAAKPPAKASRKK